MIKPLPLLATLLSVTLAAATTVRAAETMEELVAAAQREGQLTVIAMPRGWCNYGELFDAFTQKYGIRINERDPDAGSYDAVEAIRVKDKNAPDVIDVSLSAAARAKADGLLQTYKVSTWDTIPEDARDGDAAWYGGYYGVLSFAISKSKLRDVAPLDWPDLLKPDFAGMVALGGDPTRDNAAMQAIYAAGISASTGTEIDKAITAGLEYFGEMNSRGNLIRSPGSSASLTAGTTPVVIAWDYNTLAWASHLAPAGDYQVIMPQTGLVANYFPQAISANAPHPNAAKLWMEHFFSDDGQLMLMKGYCNPVRLRNLSESGKVPAVLTENRPALALHANVVFPPFDEQKKYIDRIVREWPGMISAKTE